MEQFSLLMAAGSLANLSTSCVMRNMLISFPQEVSTRVKNREDKEKTMTTRHLVDPDLIASLDAFPTLELTDESVVQIRAMIQEMRSHMAPNLPTFPDISVSERFVPGPEGAPDVRVLVYLPTAVRAPLPAMLWIHGGGYMIGSADQDDLTVKHIVSTLGCAAVSVDYRLAPETPHPGPVEDCYAALYWLSTHAGELGVDTTCIAIGGASAGGGLAAALALLARDRGEVPLAFQLLIFPMLDDRTVTMADPHPYTGEFIWTADDNRFGWRALLGQEPGGPDISPYAAAARAEHLEGLPPTFIGVGSLDLFLEEDLEYARRLMRAGVPTELHVYPGAYHGFPLAANARVSQDLVRDELAALKRAFHKFPEA
jgi:acetyl esterase/lipase